MKVTVDLEDFFLEEDESIASALKQSIISESVRLIKESIKERISVEITAVVKEMVEETMINQIREVIADCIANHKIKGKYSSDPEMSITQYIQKQFTEEAGRKAPTHEFIEKQAKALGDEIKKRYDMSFAAGIVQKLHESNLLKDENIAKLLTNEQRSV